MRAQIIADKPTVQDFQPESVAATPSPVPTPVPSSSSEQQQQAEQPSSSSSCPFLNAVAAAQDPPLVHIPWMKRLEQITKPTEFQQLLLDGPEAEGHRMVALGKTFGFSDAYMLGTGDAVRAAFAGESGADPITKQSSIPSFGEQQWMVILLGRQQHQQGLFSCLGWHR